MTKDAKSAIREEFSRAFYPFLHEDDKEPQELMENLRFSLLEKVERAMRCALNSLKKIRTRFSRRRFKWRAAFIVAASCSSAATAAATDAQHIAVEFMHPITVGRKALPAICLANDMAMVTAVANDVGFDDVFTRQIIALGREGDVLLGISTSGNSENLLHAFATARRVKLSTIGYAGNDGGKMAEMHAGGLLDFCLTVPTSSIHRIQETHVALYHITWDMVHTFLQHRSLVESG